MSEFLMATWDGAGTTPPLMSVAAALVRRGHVVRVLADAPLRPDVEEAGAEFLPWSRAPQCTAHGAEGDHIRDWEPDDPGEGFLRMRDRLAVGPARLHAADVREQIERQRPDVVLAEVFLFGALVAAEAAGVPAVVLTPTVNLVPAPGVPPFGFGFAPARTQEEHLRDLTAAAQVQAMWDEALPALQQARLEQGLAPVEHVLDQGRSADRVLVLSSAAFDFPAQLPPTVVHVGPRLDDPHAARTGGRDERRLQEGEAPLVLVALSSDFQDQGQVLQRLVDALRPLPVRALVTTGHGIDPASVDAPPHVDVVRWAPHSEVLPHVSVTVTHAGHGTVLKSLAAGVPLVCVPMGRDQLDVTARVVHAGAGVRVDADGPVESITRAVREVLGDPSYREAARRLAAAVREELREDRAVTEIEAVAARAAVSV